ncbi:hypothetical protein BX667DRAFT_518363 [Coemansia mojavensis]|nr:hypothetical protein BX667DRAFT_518363 [Coemansia mojavensis]
MANYTVLAASVLALVASASAMNAESPAGMQARDAQHGTDAHVKRCGCGGLGWGSGLGWGWGIGTGCGCGGWGCGRCRGIGFPGVCGEYASLSHWRPGFNSRPESTSFCRVWAPFFFAEGISALSMGVAQCHDRLARVAWPYKSRTEI